MIWVDLAGSWNSSKTPGKQLFKPISAAFVCKGPDGFLSGSDHTGYRVVARAMFPTSLLMPGNFPKRHHTHQILLERSGLGGNPSNFAILVFFWGVLLWNT